MSFYYKSINNVHPNIIMIIYTQCIYSNGYTILFILINGLRPLIHGPRPLDLWKNNTFIIVDLDWVLS